MMRSLGAITYLLASGLCLAPLRAAKADVLYDSNGFESFTLGSLVGAPQDGWEGFALSLADPPEVVNVSGNKKLRMSVPNGAPPRNIRKESRIVKSFSPALDLSALSEINIEMDATFDADANGSRHNFYFDFDAHPNKFLPDAQIRQDSNYVQMVRRINGAPAGRTISGNGTIHMRWRFNLTAATVDTWFGATQINTALPVSLQALIANQPGEDPDGNPQTLNRFSMALVSDLYSGPADAIYIDNFIITGTQIPITALTVQPPNIDIYAGVPYQLRAMATTGSGGQVDVTSYAAWTSDNTSVATVSAGLVTGQSPGSTTVRAAYSSQTAAAGVNVRAFPSVPAVHHPRCLLLNHDPILENRGGARLHAFAGWSDPGQLTAAYASDLLASSNGQLNQRITQTVNIDAFPLKYDGFRYTDASYADALQNGGWHSPDGVDYKSIVREFDLARKVDWGMFDEVIQYGAPYFGYYESRMAGYGGYWCNSPPLGAIACSRIFVIMGLNYERGVAEALHSCGHRSESIMARTFGSWDINQTRHDWERFTKNIGQTPLAACGTAHYPPNGLSDYDYGNPTFVNSTAIDWATNWPALTGQTSAVNAESWGGPDYHRGFFNWWYSHMPHAAGTNDHDGLPRLNSWWPYLFDFNRYAASGGDHVPGGAVPLAPAYSADQRAISANDRDDWLPQVNDAGTIVWSGFDGADFEIYVGATTSATITQITSNAGDDEAPRINAAGRLVWQRFDGQDYEIFSANVDGSNLVQLTNNSFDDWHAEINDSGRVVWDRWDGQDYEIFSANADGSNVTQVTNNSSGAYPREDVWPRINNAGRVVWSGFDGTHWAVFSANADGSGLVNVSNNSFENEYPMINDAGRVVWHAFVTEDNAEIFSADAGGGNVVRITNNAVQDWHPGIGPSGAVMWMSRAGGNWEIYSSPAQSSAPAAVTANFTHDQYPRINAAGDAVWQAFDGNDWEIYARMGGAIVRVTDNDYDDRAPYLNALGVVVWHAESASGPVYRTSEVHVAMPRRQADANCDARVDPADVPAFVLALLDPAAYATAYPMCALLRSDMDANGVVDGSDIGPFVDCLFAVGCP